MTSGSREDCNSKGAILRSPFLWVGVLLLLAIVGSLLFSDSVAELARFSAEYQRRIQQTLSGSLRDIKAGVGLAGAVDAGHRVLRLGVVHTLGPGDGKAVVVAYFLDSRGRAPGSRASPPAPGSPSPIHWRRCCWPVR